MHILYAIIGLSLILIFCNCQNDPSSSIATEISELNTVNSVVSTELNTVNTTELNTVNSTELNTVNSTELNTVNTTELNTVNTTELNTVNTNKLNTVSSVDTTTAPGSITSDVANVSKTSFATGTTFTTTSNLTESSPPETKSKLGLILGLSLGLGIPLILGTIFGIFRYRKKLRSSSRGIQSTIF